MENLKNPAIMGKKIYKLLEDQKVLLLQDSKFPSIVSQIVGGKIQGSWWGHPLANPIYNGLSWLEHNRPVLIVKLIDGKVTYLHKDLFSDFYSIVAKPRDWQLKKLGPDELKLYTLVTEEKSLQSNDKGLKTLVKDSKKSFGTLEKRLLIHSNEEHTESGVHIKVYSKWSATKFKTKINDYEASCGRIEKIVAGLAESSGTKVKLPWSSSKRDGQT